MTVIEVLRGAREKVAKGWLPQFAIRQTANGDSKADLIRRCEDAVNVVYRERPKTKAECLESFDLAIAAEEAKAGGGGK